MSWVALPTQWHFWRALSASTSDDNIFNLRGSLNLDGSSHTMALNRHPKDALHLSASLDLDGIAESKGPFANTFNDSTFDFCGSLHLDGSIYIMAVAGYAIPAYPVLAWRLQCMACNIFQ